MKTYPEIYWPKESVNEMWVSLSSQMITFEPESGLEMKIPWQRTWSVDAQLIIPAELTNFPQVGLELTDTHSELDMIDMDVVECIVRGLEIGVIPDKLVAIQQLDADAKRGSRKIEFIHPARPEFIYSLNGAGVMYESGHEVFSVDPISKEYTYKNWLRDHGFQYSDYGSNTINQRGIYKDIPGISYAGAYTKNEMYEKIHRTQEVRAYFDRGETTQILWSAEISKKDFGLFISKKPLTVPLLEICRLADEHDLDMIISSYQHGQSQYDLHKHGAHFNYHFGNAQMCIVPCMGSTYIADFETYIKLDSYTSRKKVDTFHSGIFVSPNEAARLFDARYFLSRMKSKKVDFSEALFSWERRISAFMFGYFGMVRIEQWQKHLYNNSLFDSQKHPGIVFSQLGFNLIDPIFRIEQAQSHITLDNIDNSMKKTITRIWLALERGEPIQ